MTKPFLMALLKGVLSEADLGLLAVLEWLATVNMLNYLLNVETVLTLNPGSKELEVFYNLCKR